MCLKLESFEFIFVDIDFSRYAVDDNYRLMYLITQFVVHFILIFLRHSEIFGENLPM